MPTDLGNCLEYRGPQAPGGYGSLWIKSEYRHVRLSRWIVEQAEGRQLDRSEVVAHLCDNPPCFRLSHLKIMTQAENLADMRNKGRSSAPPIRHGEESVTAKLTEDDVRSIRARPNVPTAALAAEFAVALSTIIRVRNGSTWVHVPREEGV